MSKAIKDPAMPTAAERSHAAALEQVREHVRAPRYRPAIADLRAEAEDVEDNSEVYDLLLAAAAKLSARSA